MLFRLKDGKVISLSDELIHLSKRLLLIDEDCNYMSLLTYYVNKQFKKKASEFIELISSTYTLDHKITYDDIVDCVKRGTDTYNKYVETYKHYGQISKYVYDNLSLIFDDTIIHIKSISEKGLIMAIQFLTIVSPKRSLTMFDDLPMLIRINEIKTVEQLREQVNEDLHVYLDFVLNKTNEEKVELCAVSSDLGINPLVKLIACVIAIDVMNMKESHFRKVFHIPIDHKNTLYKEIQDLEKQHKWLATSN